MFAMKLVTGYLYEVPDNIFVMFAHIFFRNTCVGRSHVVTKETWSRLRSNLYSTVINMQKRKIFGLIWNKFHFLFHFALSAAIKRELTHFIH